MCLVMPPSTPGTIALRMRVLAKVPRIMTSWLPRREPKLLKSAFCTPCSVRYLPAGPSFLMSPAGEMWSVVLESLFTARQRAPLIGWMPGGVLLMPTKYGGLATYVDFGSQL